MTKTASLVALLAVAVPAQQSIVDTARGDARLSTLVTALSASSAAAQLAGPGPFTVFAPTDEAFARLDQQALKALLQPANRAELDALLRYHVVPGTFRASDVLVRNALPTANGQRLPVVFEGDTVRIDEAGLVVTDIVCSNGIVHVVDAVLTPESRSLAGVAKAGKQFTTLLAAVKAAGLADALMGDGPFTVLAPTDAAFAALPAGTLESLLQPENRAQLQAILKYHVIAGRIDAAAAVTAGAAVTLQGAAVAFEIVDGRLRAGGKGVIATDLQARNGVVHVIDAVLLPPQPARPAGRLVLGLQLEEPSSALAAQLDLQPEQALVVTEVTEGGKALAAGVKAFDVVVSVDGKPASRERLAAAKERAGFGGTVELGLLRRGRRLQLPVEVGVEKH